MLFILSFAVLAPIVIVALLIRNTTSTPIAQVLYDTEQSRVRS